DGSFADQPASIAASVGGLGTTTATLSADVTGLPAAAYLVRLNATGAAGRTAQATRSVTVEQSPDIVIGAGKIGDGYNLTAGMSLDQARAFLLDPAEFGPGGVVDVASLRIVDAVPTITADYLAGIDILFTGWIQSAAWTDAELQLVGNWVVGGGVVISTNDDVTHDGLATYWGEPVLGQSANPWFPADAAHPLVAGPFGTWSSITTAGNFGYFSPAGSTVLARDASNRATVMERTIGAGHIFLVADEGVFRSNFVAGANRSFAGNLFALAIGQRAAGADLPPIFVDTPRTLDAVVGTAITPVVANAVDPEGAALTFSATNLAPGLGFDPATRTLTGTPTTAGTYATELRATDMAGNSTAWAVTVTVRPVVVDAQPPTVPANLTLTSNGVDAVTLNWAPSTDDVAVKGYLVHRDFQFLAFVPAGTTFTDRPVSRGATYRYQVRAQDTSNNTSAPSATAAITVGAAGDVTAPTTPPSASASTNGTDRVTLNWGPSTDDVAVTGYLVHRDFAFLAFVPAGTTYTDTTAVAGATYRYQVRAQDAAGNNSEPTAPLRITVAPGGVDTTPPSTPANLAASFVAGSGVRLNWSASGDDDRVGGYLVHRDFQFVAFVPAGTTYTDPAALPGGHTYEVRAQDPTGNNSPPASVSITVP
ncbi:MAG: putative Ig domain-containing protein, partial [Acidimicrobiia bacterium]|nr:putative Ig domain-containing protein [Acidimicrobiia bacterium]